ncbi:hypothetical protein [Candidatus Neoehrlichia procyonis]|nr:hypothetical protein [Candidatus Neoehrlichia lotoris]
MRNKSIIGKIYKYDVSIINDIDKMNVSDIFHIMDQGTILHELFCALYVCFEDNSAYNGMFNIIKTHYYKFKQYEILKTNKAHNTLDYEKNSCQNKDLEIQRKFKQDQTGFIPVAECICDIIYDKIVRAINNKEISINAVNDFLSCEASILDNHEKVSCIDILSRVYINSCYSDDVDSYVYSLWKNFLLKFALYKIDGYGRNTLQYAILLCDEKDQERCIVEIIKPIIDYHKGIESILDEEGNNIMHYAVGYASCNYKIIQYIGESFPDLINVENNKGDVPLHLLVAMMPVYIFLNSFKVFRQFFMVKKLYDACKETHHSNAPIRQMMQKVREYSLMIQQVKLQEQKLNMQVYEAFLLLFNNTLCCQIMKQSIIQGMLIFYKESLDWLMDYKKSGNLLCEEYGNAIMQLLKNHTHSSINAPISINEFIDYAVQDKNYVQFITHGISDNSKSLLDIQFYKHTKKINNIMMKYYSTMSIPFKQCDYAKQIIFKNYKNNVRGLFIGMLIIQGAFFSIFVVSLIQKNKMFGMSCLPYRHVMLFFVMVGACMITTSITYLEYQKCKYEMQSMIMNISNDIYNINLQKPCITVEKDSV